MIFNKPSQKEETHNLKTIIVLSCFLLMAIMLIGNVSALEFDNIKSYYENTKTYTIENALGFGEKIADIQLITPQVFKVGVGYHYVAEFELRNYNNKYGNAFKDMNFYQINNDMKEFTREFDYKYLDYENVQVPDYIEVCGEKQGNYSCVQEENGFHWEEREIWIKFSDINELPQQESVRIRIYTNTIQGESVEWVPTLFGEYLDKWAVWTADLNVDLVAYYSFNESSGNLIDQSGNGNTGTNNGASYGATGIITTAYDFELSEVDRVRIDDGTGDIQAIGDNDFTINLWINAESTGTLGTFLGASSDGSLIFFHDSSNHIGMAVKGSAGVFGVATFSDATFTMITMKFDASENQMIPCIDGSCGSPIAFTGTFGTGSPFDIGTFGTTSYPFDGIIDEMGIWSRALTPDEITQLYNGGDGITYTDVFDTAPTITHISPANNTNFTTTEVTLSVNVTDNIQVDNVSLYIDGSLNNTNTSQVNGTYSWTYDFADGDYTWFVSAWDNNSQQTNLSEYYFSVDTIPFIEYVTPPTLENYANITQEYIPIKVNVSTPYFFNITYSLRNVNGTNYTQYYENETFDINFTDIPDGHYHYDVNVCTTTNQCNTTETRHINHDVTAPSINITSPSGGYNLLYEDYNLTLNFTATEAQSELDNCWYNYNGINNTLACSNGTAFVTGFNYTKDVNNLTVYSNDTFGNTNSSITTWDYKIFEENQSFSESIIEGSLEDFFANITVGDGFDVVSATLYYNGENESSSIISAGDLRRLYLTDFLIPNVDVNTNITFYWGLVLNDTTEINLTSNNQTVLAVGLDNCSTNTFKLFNISLYDEETLELLNGTIEIYYYVQNKPLYNIVQNFSGKFENIDNTLVCSNINLSDQGLAYSSEIRYYSSDYVYELYHIQKSDIEDYVNLSLYDLNQNDSTEFKVNYQDSSITKVPNAVVQLQRKYISENLYRVVEAPITSADGTAILHIDLNSNKYKVTIVKDGEILDTFDNIVFACQSQLSGQCEQNLYAEIDPQNDVEIETLNDFSYTITPSGNNTITLDFSIPSGVPSNINFILLQYDQFGNETVCNKTIISSAGSTECTYNDTLTESYLTLKVSKGGIPQAIKSYIIPEAGAVDFLGNNFFIVFIFLLSIVGMAFSAPEWIILNSVVVIILSGALWLLNGLNFVMGLEGLAWLILGSGILIFKLAKQEDR